jgi:Zn-finger nucleic acid-binding protein
LSMICGYCSSGTTPQGDDDGVRVTEVTSHHCPVCEAALANGLIESLEMLYCTGCHGMLFKMGSLPPLLPVLREHRYRFRNSEPPHRIDPGRILHCPLCKKKMDKVTNGTRQMDSCRRCLVTWLDRAVLSRIVAA